MDNRWYLLDILYYIVSVFLENIIFWDELISIESWIGVGWKGNDQRK